MEVNERVIEGLRAMGIPFDLISHPAAHTMADCEGPARELGGLMPKNLFLVPKNRKVFWLCVTRPDAVFRTSDVSKQVGSARLSFAPEEDLMRLLLTRPGAISPMGLMFEEAREVRLIMDEQLKDEKRLIFHPCVNTFSLAMSGEDFFERFLPATGHEVTYVTM